MDRLNDVWAERDFPVLREATRIIDAGGDPPVLGVLADATGLPTDQVELALKALQRRGYLEVQGTFQYLIGVKRISGEAYTITGLHPDGGEAIHALIQMLRQTAGATKDLEERSKLNRAADALGNIGGQVAAGVMSAFLAHASGFS